MITKTEKSNDAARRLEPSGEIQIAKRTESRREKRVFHAIASKALDCGSIFLNATFGELKKEAFGALMYHRVAPAEPKSSPPTWNVTPERFRKQLSGLLALGFEAWPLSKALERRRNHETIPRRVFVVTFDDGYQCVYKYAWPILRELKIPATVFLVTDLLDDEGPMPFDDWSLAGRTEAEPSVWRSLMKKQCVEMLESKLIEVGGHTHRHLDYRGRPDAFFDDLRESKRKLLEWFGIETPPFAYPFGLVGSEMRFGPEKTGYSCALTTDAELIVPQSDPYYWSRFNVKQSDSPRMLEAKLGGWYSVLRSMRPGFSTSEKL